MTYLFFLLRISKCNNNKIIIGILNKTPRQSFRLNTSVSEYKKYPKTFVCTILSGIKEINDMIFIQSKNAKKIPNNLSSTYKCNFLGADNKQ